MGIRVGVAGASGYAGGELLRLLAGHPEFDLVTATAHSQAGRPVGAVHPHLSGLDLTLTATGPDAFADADLVFLALPHGQSAALANELPETVKIVDLGADFRLHDGGAWERYYGGPHAGTWTYGLPELPGQRERIANSARVANTGCYAVTTILALAPLIAAGVADPEDVVVVASSGTSGAGKSPKPHLLASEVMGGLSTYKTGRHQHVPEIKQATGAKSLSFTPVLAPMPRGILATVTARALGDADPHDVLKRAYAADPFVHVLEEDQWPRTASVSGSNSVHLQATVDVDSGRIIAVSASDNLGKGAAGQAVQNANLMFGLPETTGLQIYGVAP
ncbi:N-acetyl-gamma-glutamyl-phosphate reductase [Catenuloplanes atrovinosus]|uniref:N-acetyl-gamma-glutamyl-phosphate reductase n=1 Tax=Catenuloplanes atrovinosus TaxID=137266 RepID=A0AAE3YIY2_9ACTN|nr:N-acetyl-gamma-glutamyl-phosphate reductase [Catenuloplanes atrovinosus]MDR7274340.1 N-acetyl-gamma-glutamyl-phosphate reductase [Catenuloplanes atrovinosus]